VINFPQHDWLSAHYDSKIARLTLRFAAYRMTLGLSETLRPGAASLQAAAQPLGQRTLALSCVRSVSPLPTELLKDGRSWPLGATF